MQLMEESYYHAGACHANWMAEGNCTTLRIQLLSRNTQLFNCVSCLTGESLIDFIDIDIIDR